MQRLRGLLGGQPEEQQEVDVLERAQARVQQEPSDAGAHFDVGTIHYVRGRLDEAVEELQRAVELAPEDGEAHYMLGLAYQKVGRLDDARRAFRATIEKTDNAMLQNYAQQKLNEVEGAPAQKQEAREVEGPGGQAGGA